jgi:hypothetical protein
LGVSNAAKLVAEMWRNQHGTSHVIFRHPTAGRLSVPAHRPIKPVYVRLFVDFVSTLG